MIYVEIDELTPCLKDCKTGEIVDTEVIRIKRKSFLSKYNKKNGWYVNWASLVDENEIYALVLKGTVDIQGLLAVRYDKNMQATFVSWMVAAPHNNKLIGNEKKFEGVGGHLFAIAVDVSIGYGCDGEFTGFAANEELEKHYCEKFDAVKIHMLHPYQILISEEAGMKIKEVYTYEWTEEEF